MAYIPLFRVEPCSGTHVKSLGGTGEEEASGQACGKIARKTRRTLFPAGNCESWKICVTMKPLVTAQLGACYSISMSPITRQQRYDYR